MWVFRLKASYLLLWSSTHKRLRRKLNNLNFTTNVWNKFHLNWFCNLLKYHSTGSTPYIMWYCWIMNALSNTVLYRHLTIIFIFHPWYIFAIFWSMIAPILSSISLRRGHFTQLCRHKFFAFSNKRTCFWDSYIVMKMIVFRATIKHTFSWNFDTHCQWGHQGTKATLLVAPLDLGWKIRSAPGISHNTNWDWNGPGHSETIRL